MTRNQKPSTPVGPRKIVVSNNRPQIRITEHTDGLASLVIPSVSRRALALAHAIVSAFLCNISDEQNLDMLAPTITPGDARLTCLVITIELHRFGPVSIVRNVSIRRTKIAFLAKALRDAARHLCTPLYGGDPLYDVVTEIVT